MQFSFGLSCVAPPVMRHTLPGPPWGDFYFEICCASFQTGSTVFLLMFEGFHISSTLRKTSQCISLSTLSPTVWLLGLASYRSDPLGEVEDVDKADEKDVDKMDLEPNVDNYDDRTPEDIDNEVRKEVKEVTWGEDGEINFIVKVVNSILGSAGQRRIPR